MSEPVKIVIACRKIDEQWEGAVISQNRFTRALINKDLYKMITSQLTGLLVSDRPEGTEITLELGIVEKIDGNDQRPDN